MRSLLSVQIPALNSEATLESCISSIGRVAQDFVDVVVIDGGSTDSTVRIARGMGARIIVERRGLLYSRIAGIESADSTWVLLLDSDQELASSALERVPTEGSPTDMYVLGEGSLDSSSALGRLYRADRELCVKGNISADPIRGVQMPRLFRTSLLKQAVSQIPRTGLEGVRYPDHAIIHYEMSLLTSRVGYFPDFLFHRENTSLKSLFSKHYKYGLDSVTVSRIRRYRSLIRGKSSPFRPLPRANMILRWFQAEFLMSLKGASYSGGALVGIAREKIRLNR